MYRRLIFFNGFVLFAFRKFYFIGNTWKRCGCHSSRFDLLITNYKSLHVFESFFLNASSLFDFDLSLIWQCLEMSFSFNNLEVWSRWIRFEECYGFSVELIRCRLNSRLRFIANIRKQLKNHGNIYLTKYAKKSWEFNKSNEEGNKRF